MNSHYYLKVGFQKREDTYGSILGFIIPEKENNKNFLKWIDPKIPTKTFVNEPVKGFIFNKTIKRKFTYSTSEKIRVFHPQGFEFEINMSNVSFILAHSNVIAQEISSACVLGWHCGQIQLIPVNTDEGKAILEQNKHDQNFSSLSIGNNVTIKNKEMVYLGEQIIKDLRFDSYYGQYASFRGEKKHLFYSKSDLKFVTYSSQPNFDNHFTSMDLSQINNSYTLLKNLDIPQKLTIPSVIFAGIVYNYFHQVLTQKNIRDKSKCLIETINSLFSYLYIKNERYHIPLKIEKNLNNYSLNGAKTLSDKFINDLIKSDESSFISLFISEINYTFNAYYFTIEDSHYFLKNSSEQIWSQKGIYDFNTNKISINTEANKLFSKLISD